MSSCITVFLIIVAVVLSLVAIYLTCFKLTPVEKEVMKKINNKNNEKPQNIVLKKNDKGLDCCPPLNQSYLMPPQYKMEPNESTEHSKKMNEKTYSSTPETVINTESYDYEVTRSCNTHTSNYSNHSSSCDSSSSSSSSFDISSW